MAYASVGYADQKKTSARNIVAWVLCVLAAAEFLFAGGLKVIGYPMEVSMFGIIGWGQWFRYFTAMLEVVGAIGLLIPRRSRRAALLLSLVMLGAITFHLTAFRHTEFSNPASAIVTLVVLLAIVRLRRNFRSF